MVTRENWLEANDNADLCNIAGDIAADAMRSYCEARDAACTLTDQAARDMAAEIAFAYRRGWDFDTSDPNDPAGDLAKRVLAKLGYCVRSGSIGFDATLQPAT